MSTFTVKLKRLVSKPGAAAYLALIVLCAIATITAPTIFPTWTNLSNLLRQASVAGVVSIGMTVVLLIGGIDLSVTSTMAISACLLASTCQQLLTTDPPGSTIWIVLLILAIGIGIGFLNGVMIVYRRVESFIVTLGMMYVVKGINYMYTGGAPVGTLTPFWIEFGSESLFGIIPYPVLLFIALMAIFVFVLRRTIYGKHLYAIGNNAEAARLSGIKVQRSKVVAFMLCSLMASVAGIMLCARVRVGEPNGSTGFDMDAIAAVIIGGTSMSGGQGSLWGTLAGVLIIAVMSNMLNILSADPYLQIAIKGVVVLFAVLVQKKR